MKIVAIPSQNNVVILTSSVRSRKLMAKNAGNSAAEHGERTDKRPPRNAAGRLKEIRLLPPYRAVAVNVKSAATRKVTALNKYIGCF